MNRNVGNVEEEAKQEVEKAECAVTLDAGGVFWINSVEKECRQCEGFQSPKRTVRADTSWRRRLAVEEKPVPVSNRFSSLAVKDEDQEIQPQQVDRQLRKSMERDILAMGSDFGII